MIELGGETGDWETDRRSVSRADLIGIMRPRVEEILEKVGEILDAAGFDFMPSQQIVLTGGGSQIPGLDGLAARMLGQMCASAGRCAFRACPITRPARFSSAVGLALFAAHPQDEWWDFDMPTEPIRRAACAAPIAGSATTGSYRNADAVVGLISLHHMQQNGQDTA
jgi:cell division protein FtsA